MSKNSKCSRSLGVVARHLGIAAVLLTTAGLAPGVVAADDDSANRSADAAGAPERQQASASDRQRTASGLLLSVDDAGIVVHRSAESDLRLTVDGGTHVARDGRNASLSDLREGEEVRASYQNANGVAKAIRIEAESGEVQNVRTISPDDSEWDQVHQGG